MKSVSKNPFDRITIILNGSTPPQPQNVSSQTAATVDKLLGGKLISHGSVEGYLKAISDREGNVAFSVITPSNNDRVICIVKNELESQVLSNFRKRVRLYGLVRYDKEGYPYSINVEEIETLPSFEDMKQPKEFLGILSPYGS